MRLPAAILFDMDGVLVKSEDAWFQVASAAGLRFRGRAVTREEFGPTFGQGTAADVSTFGLACSTEELDAFYVSEFSKHLDEIWVNPDARPVLEYCVQHGISRAVVTNTVNPLAHTILQHAKLAGFFEIFATAERVAHAKPAPDLLVLALRELRAKADQAWMVGDSKFDRLAAQAAHVKFIGLGLDAPWRIERLTELMISEA